MEREQHIIFKNKTHPEDLCMPYNANQKIIEDPIRKIWLQKIFNKNHDKCINQRIHVCLF